MYVDQKVGTVFEQSLVFGIFEAKCAGCRGSGHGTYTLHE